MNDMRDSFELGQSETFPLYIDGNWEPGEGEPFTLLNKYTLQPMASISSPSDEQIVKVIDSAHAAFRAGAPVAYERGVILDKAAVLIAERRDSFIRIMQQEAGFTAADAGGEVNRCIQTLRLSAEEARRLAGDVIPLEGAPNQAGRLAFTVRVPLGVVAAITPFNAPLNTVTHKIAPAFAAGNSVILKPSSNTPLTAMKLVEVLVEAGMPKGFLSLVQGRGRIAEALLGDDRVRFFAFTGSTEVGRSIQKAAGLRRTQMELGSIAFTLVCDDADLDTALTKVVNAGYRKAGQVCTSVQILMVDRKVMADVQDRLTAKVKALSYGDPENPDTFVGPLISEKEAIRIESWIAEAVAKGARILAGGTREGAVLAPTLLTDIDASMNVGACEIFGPVVCLVPFDTLDEAIDRVNSTPFGLASGIFTNRIKDAFTTALKLEVGGVHINETSSSRVDMMPYGGSKDSGFGREGPYYAVHEMTEERIITISLT
ncbi:aldehyde dehydrogenase family protein [Roseibium aggregatum]|uniref:Aldehyde dehydrogenase family protein n=1 Tax=Roseibium aggregatum TaxID=187304 RepID=A0A926SAD3_9HYPH|nr:aldehyde dehydrogenase family protein [Roseibium aggregatum]MBD1548814.1 aldehyde dehydrogenase family protein [Roseibium aggregatum]